MRFDPSRCASCGGPPPINPISSEYGLTEDGRFCPEELFFFCSDSCLEREINKHVPDEFVIGKTARDTAFIKEFEKEYDERNKRLFSKNELYSDQELSEFQRWNDDDMQRAQAFVDDWEKQREQVMRGAVKAIAHIWYADAIQQKDQRLRKEAEQERARQEKEAERQRIRMEREEERERTRMEREDEKARVQEERDRQRLREELIRLDDQGEHLARLEAEYADMMTPKPIPDQIRFTEHTHILGPTRSGKTTLIQQLLIDDLKKPDPPAYVIIDPKGLLIERVSKLAVFNERLKDRLVVVDPSTKPYPSLGMFHIPDNRALLNQLLTLFGYIFSSAKAQLTQRQSIPFSYVVRLVFSIGGNLNTLMDVLEETKPTNRFSDAIAKLSATDDGIRRFFQNDFYDKEFNPTRQQIRTRVYEIISRPELMAMLGHPVNKVSMLDALNQGKIVLVNTAMTHLNPEGSTLFGRYMIAQTVAAAFARTSRKPCFLVIDEFQDFADEEQTPRMLRLAGEYNLGIVIAHQAMYCAELNDALRTSISTNTSIKYAASPEGIDLGLMSRDLRCDPEFLRSMQKTKTHAQFATYVRGIGLERPFVTQVRLGNIDYERQISDAAHAALLRSQREKLYAPRQSPPPQPPRPEPPKPPPKTPPRSEQKDPNVIDFSKGKATVESQKPKPGKRLW